MNRLTKSQRRILLLICFGTLTMEIIGVLHGFYFYGSFPLKIFGVPLAIPIGWSIICFLSYFISTKKGILIGIVCGYLIDLALEPIAFYTTAWTWASTGTPQIYFGSTIGNTLVWVTVISISTVTLSKVGNVR